MPLTYQRYRYNVSGFYPIRSNSEQLSHGVFKIMRYQLAFPDKFTFWNENTDLCILNE